ncbi:terminase [Nocardia transvalensis]|uniref:terminase n=1 Tax=Nocardia transvalensis TaxID=37333 RepID=UPI00189486D0|nr:terminase [Nocardia transvalensis]MBF6328743.1 terminase [Nocardia transvalensis]
MAVARDSGPALISTPESEFAEIIAWYENQLATTVPPVDLEWEPVKVGPTWQWDPNTGWHLPELTLGWRVLAWCGKWLRDKKGQPWQFTPEQARFVLWFYAIDEHGDFLYHSAVLQRLKGWGKDPIAACLAMAACFAEVTFDHWEGGRPVGRDEPNAWVQIIAVAEAQTKNTMKLFPGLVPRETRDHYGIQIGKLNVWGLGDTRHIEAVTSNPLTVEGGRPTLVIRAETQNWNSSNSGHDMAGALEGNAAKSEVDAPARMLDICNACRDGEDSVGERMRDAYDSTVGESPTARDFGLMYDSLEAPPEAPLTAEAAPAVLEAIKGDSYWLDTRPNGRIVKSILNTANPPSESRRKWYNQRLAAADAWLTRQQWDALGDPDCRPACGERAFLFGDGSKSDDATAVIGCHLDTGNLFYVGIWQRPAGWSSKQRWIVDRADVDRRVRDACAVWDVLGFWFDPSDARDDETGERFWEPFCDDWAQIQDWQLPAVVTGDFRHPVIWDMRNPRWLKLHTEAAERFTTDVADKAFRHDAHKLHAQHVYNAKRRPNKFGVGLGKEHRESLRKVDAAVASVGARLMRQMWLSVPRQEMTYEAMFV